MSGRSIEWRIDAAFTRLLVERNVSVAITVGPGGVVVLGHDRQGGPAVEHRVVNGGFALAVYGDKLAVSHRQGITVYRNVPGMAAEHPERGDRHDAWFTPLLTFHTGDCQVHDMVATPLGLVVVNTRFSTIDLIDGSYNTKPIWQPAFISHPMPEDRCHLNGMAFQGDRVRYVTAFGLSDSVAGWRKPDAFHGVLIDAQSGAVVADGLSLPHSPRLFGERLMFCESGHGAVVDVDPADGRRHVLCTLPGLTRGMALHGDVLFIGMSTKRPSNSLPTPPLVQSVPELIAGVAAIDARTGALLGMARIVSPDREVFDLKLIPGAALPGIGERNDHDDAHLIESTAGAYWLAARPNKHP